MTTVTTGVQTHLPAFEVGEWTVEPALHQLSRQGKLVRIEPKAMAVLVCLAERPGQVISREALLSTVWAGVVVGDDALTQVVVKLRKALGDMREEPAYIETISKSGYRLVAPVVRAAPQPVSVAPPGGVPTAWQGRRGLRPAAAVAVLLLGAAVAWWWQEGRDVDARRGLPPYASVETAGAALPTVAVRPFEALAGDAEELLLARGLTADLITDLSKVAGLWVVDRMPDVATQRGEPGVAAPGGYLVAGTVQRFERRFRLQVRLVDAQTGRQLWSERFERPLGGVFEVQDEMGRAILGLLPVKVSEAEARRVAQRYTRDLQAYEAFQRGRAALHVRRQEDNGAARRMFRQAIDLDAGFARAYAGLALTYAAEYRYQWAGDRAAALERAYELARTALQMNPDIAETYWTLAFVHVHRHQHRQALQALEQALRLYPSYADAYAMMGGIYTSIGQPADGVPLLRTAMRLAPESGYLWQMLLGRAYLYLGDLEQARVNLRHSLARNPGFIDAHVYLAAAHVLAGEQAEAAWQADEIRVLQPDFSVRRWLETNPTADGALKERLVGALGAVDLQ